MEPAAPSPTDDHLWIKYTRERAFPISALTSALLHFTFLALVLLGVLSLFRRHDAGPIEFEPVIIAEEPGGGSHGQDDGIRAGVASGAEAVSALEQAPRMPLPDAAAQTFPTVQHQPPPEPLLNPDEVPAVNPLERASIKPAMDFKPLLKGLPDSKVSRGNAGRGSGQGPGTGPGQGVGDGSAGRLSQKQKRQLRWVLLFTIKSPPHYLDQLHRLKAIIGVQYPDHSIKLVNDLSRRPAKLEAGDRVPDRIFWMDDNPEAVGSLAAELGIRPAPWRIIAFFPPQLEEDLLRREKAYGKRFGRETEDDIQETVFRVEDRFGVMDVSVESQTGKK